MDFVAIDFETANSERNSACALGAVLIENNKIVQRRYSLINPHVPFHRFCTYVHGITEAAVVDSPSFGDIYPVLFKMLDGRDLYAHNASFDVAVLQASCDARGLVMPGISPHCSVEMSRKAWPELEHHRLNSLCDYFKLPLKHHNAVEDATACALIVLKAAEQFGASTPAQLEEILDSVHKKYLIEKKREEIALKRKLDEARAELGNA